MENNENASALDSVRGLEEKLDDRRAAEKAAEDRVATARQEAERLVREARQTAANDAAEHRREALERADGEAENLLMNARSKVGTLRALAAADQSAAAREVVGMILPGVGSGREA